MDEINKVEVLSIMNKIKCRKVMGFNGLSMEIRKVLGENRFKWLVTLFNLIMSEGKMPMSGRNAI